MIITTLQRVLLRPYYALLFVLIAFTSFTFIVWLPNLTLIEQVVLSLQIPLLQKLTLLLSLYSAITTNFNALSLTFAIVLAILFGLNISLFVYYLRRVQSLGTSRFHFHLSSVGGFVSGLLGIGCAACGSIVLTAFLTSVGAGGLLLLLPLHGSEFGILGSGLLLWSSYTLIKKINDPLVCEVN